MNKYYHQINLPEENKDNDNFTQKQLKWLLENLNIISQQQLKKKNTKFIVNTSGLVKIMTEVSCVSFDSISKVKNQFLRNYSKPVFGIECRLEKYKQIFWLSIEKKQDEWYFVTVWATHKYDEESESFVSLLHRDFMSSFRYYLCDGFKGLMVYLKENHFLKINA